MHLSSRSSIGISLQQYSIAVASLLANRQELSLDASELVLNYARNIDAVSRIANIDNSHVYNSTVSFDQTNNSLFEVENSEPLTVVQKSGALYTAFCSRCEIRHYISCVASTEQTHDIARLYQDVSILDRSELAIFCFYADLDNDVYIISANVHITSIERGNQFQKRI